MFRRFALISAVAVSCFMMVGCYSVKVCAPAGADVSLASADKRMAFKKKIKNWYVLCGLVPISGTEDAVLTAIKNHGLTDVRIETKQTFTDWLVLVFLEWWTTVVSNTTIIEGAAN